MIESTDDRYRLTIPMSDAIRFAIGMSDLNYDQPCDELRQLVGLLAMDMLEYSEQWRAAGLLRECMRSKWPDLFD